MSRLKELENMAIKTLTGEEIALLLRTIDPKLEKEYNKLAYGGE